MCCLFLFEQDAFVKISHTEGVSSLWSGLSPTLVLAVPATIVYFVSYENLRLYIKDSYGGNQPFWAPMVAGATARSVSVSLVSPLELVRTKMQSKRISYLEIGEALKTLLHYHGVGGLFKGLGSTLLRDVPFSAIYWFNYEGIKAKFSTGVPSFGFSFMAGAVAGSIAAILTNPFDVVKTHQQIELGEKEIYSAGWKPSDLFSAGWEPSDLFSAGWEPSDWFSAGWEPNPPKRGSSMLTVLQRIYQQSGTRGLFAGLVPRLVKVAPACAIMISTFEYGKYFFHRSQADNIADNVAVVRQKLKVKFDREAHKVLLLMACIGGLSEHSVMVISLPASMHVQASARNIGESVMSLMQDQSGKLQCTFLCNNFVTLVVLRIGLEAVDHLLEFMEHVQTLQCSPDKSLWRLSQQVGAY
uniref:Uncharacterized protein n=1 Tax=Timema genevievae TaxID=629358 RepID=A0A7R9PI52_TIMGE|nr:unnamed protein product [Timema genevievae]